MAPASSLHGGCPPIAEHQEYAPCMPPPEMTMMQHDVIVPNPDYKIAANLWDLNIAQCARSPSPLSTFIRHCNTMESPHYPTYSKQGVWAPADDISDLNRSSSSIENLRELQKYSEKLTYESTCCRLWAEGIQTQIKDEQEKVQKCIAGVTEELLRMKRLQYAQPAWTQPLLNPLQPVPPAPPSVPSQPASSSSASMHGAGQTSSYAQESLYGSSPSESSISIIYGNGPMGRSQDEAAALATDLYVVIRDVQLQKANGIQLRCGFDETNGCYFSRHLHSTSPRRRSVKA